MSNDHILAYVWFANLNFTKNNPLKCKNVMNSNHSVTVGQSEREKIAPETLTFLDLSWNKVLSCNYDTKKQYKIVKYLHY